MDKDTADLKYRLERDENSWLKIQEQANRHHANTLNQLADLFSLVQRLTQKVEKQGILIRTLETKLIKVEEAHGNDAQATTAG